MDAFLLEIFGNPIITGLLGVLLGTLLGHKLSLGRDKRKEYNQAIEVLRVKSLKHLDSMANDKIGNMLVNSDEIISLKAVIGHKLSKNIESTFDLYEQTYNAVFKTQIPSTPINPQPINTDKIPECRVALKQFVEALELK
jgi:hypothetical protein